MLNCHGARYDRHPQTIGKAPQQRIPLLSLDALVASARTQVLRDCWLLLILCIILVQINVFEDGLRWVKVAHVAVLVCQHHTSLHQVAGHHKRPGWRCSAYRGGRSAPLVCAISELPVPVALIARFPFGFPNSSTSVAVYPVRTG